MALSLEDKHRIIYHLGLPGKTLLQDSTHYNSVVVSRLTNLDIYIEDKVCEILDELDTARTSLQGSASKGNVKRIGDIELDTDKTRDLAMSEYQRLVKELSVLLDINTTKRSGPNFNVCL